MTATGSSQPGTHVLRELGFEIRRSGEELYGSAEVNEHMLVPGTSHLRTSVLAAWADTLAGLLAVDAMRPRVPVTLELDVNLYQPAPGSGGVYGRARVVKSGRSVFVASVDFTTEEGHPVAIGAASFMAAHDTSLRVPPLTSVDMTVPEELRLRIPLAERARCRRVDRGVAVLPRSEDGLNSSNTVNGGLLALVAEEAALSEAPRPTSLASIDLHYLQPVRVGPVVATAGSRDGLGRVELRDAGNDDRLAVVATTRTFPGSP